MVVLGKQTGWKCSRIVQDCRPCVGGCHARLSKVGKRHKASDNPATPQLTGTLLLQSCPRVASTEPFLAEEPEGTDSSNVQQRLLSNASASSSGSRDSYDRDGSYQPYGSRLKIRKGPRPSGWLHYLGDDYLPQQLSQVRSVSA
jgi:hypothetical protein